MSKVLVLGCGSIGSRHVQYLISQTGGQVIVVDPAADEIKKSFSVDQKLSWFTDLEEVPSEELDFVDYGVVATLGPQHRSHASQLAALGVNKIIVEKPLGNSLNDHAALFAPDFGARIWVNYSLRYLGLVEGIDKVSKSEELGDLLSLNVSGGAKCLATNGIHFLDLACKFFGEPTDCKGIVSSSSLNPRGGGLLFLEGVVALRFDRFRHATVAFQNGSHGPAKAHLVFEKGELEWTEMKMATLTKRDLSEDTPSTRSKPVLERKKLSLVSEDANPFRSLHKTVMAGESFDRHDPAFVALITVLQNELKLTTPMAPGTYAIS